MIGGKITAAISARFNKGLASDHFIIFSIGQRRTWF
jgi:hypothetical protein